MKKALIFLFSCFLSQTSFANPMDKLLFWEKCSFACKIIPPIEYSYVTKPISIMSKFKLENQQNDSSVKDSYRVLVWNIYKSRKENWKEDFKKYTNLSEIHLLQEVVLDDLFKSGLNSDFDWDLAVSFMLSKGDYPTGVLNSSVFQKNNSKIYRTVDREPFSSTPKMMLSTKYQLPDGQKLLVINIHGINFRKKVGLLRQVNQAKEEISDHDGPVIFAGDFNTKSKGRRKALDKFMSDLGMEKITWENDERSSFLNLDHFYYRGLEIKKAEMLKNLTSSDHPMMLVDIFYN